MTRWITEEETMLFHALPVRKINQWMVIKLGPTGVQWAVLCKRASGSYGTLDAHPTASRHYSLNPSHVVTLDRKTNANNPWKTRNLTDRASSLGRKIALSAPASAPLRFGGHRRRSTGWSAASASSNSSPSSLPTQVICVFPTRDEPH